ncbi:MAG: MerR family transcriptional regulator [Chloroflexi bacterium]|nr:MerR family transcriptional regulator [Chloroflexota bacterium]
MEYSIGDLSKITRVSGKTLHQYHLDGLVVPARIDKFSQRRYYSEKSFHRVEVVRQLTKMGLPLETIKDFLSRYFSSGQFFKRIQENLTHSSYSLEAYGLTHEALKSILHASSDTNTQTGKLEEKVLPNLIVRSKRFTAKPDEFVPHLEELQKTHGSLAVGNPIILFHDDHQFEEETNMECCLPVSSDNLADGVITHELKGARAVAVEYSGPISGIWKAYARIINHLNNNNLAIQTPSREVVLEPIKMLPEDKNPHIHVEVQFLTGDPNDPGFTRNVSRPGYGINAAFDL